MNDFIFFMMMMGGELGGIIKAPEPFYEAPEQPSPRADYFDNVCTNMLADPAYAAKAAEIAAAQAIIVLFRDAILEAIPGGDGKVAARNVAQLNMDNEMDYLLPEIFKVGNSDPVNAIVHYQTIGVSWKTREGWEWDIIEVRNGKISGSFDLFVNPPEGRFAAMWWYTDKPEPLPEDWKFADFSHSARGYIEGLTPGTYYHFRAKTSSSVGGKTDWTQVIKIMCT